MSRDQSNDVLVELTGDIFVRVTREEYERSEDPMVRLTMIKNRLTAALHNVETRMKKRPIEEEVDDEATAV